MAAILHPGWFQYGVAGCVVPSTEIKVNLAHHALYRRGREDADPIPDSSWTLKRPATYRRTLLLRENSTCVDRVSLEDTLSDRT